MISKYGVTVPVTPIQGGYFVFIVLFQLSFINARPFLIFLAFGYLYI